MAYLQNAGSHLLALQTGGAPPRAPKDIEGSSWQPKLLNRDMLTKLSAQVSPLQNDVGSHLLKLMSQVVAYRRDSGGNKKRWKNQVLEPAFFLFNHKAKYSSSVNFFLQIRTDDFLGFKNALTWAKMDPREWNNIRCVSFFLLLWSKIGKMMQNVHSLEAPRHKSLAHRTRIPLHASPAWLEAAAGNSSAMPQRSAPQTTEPSSSPWQESCPVGHEAPDAPGCAIRGHHGSMPSRVHRSRPWSGQRFQAYTNFPALMHSYPETHALREESAVEGSTWSLLQDPTPKIPACLLTCWWIQSQGFRPPDWWMPDPLPLASMSPLLIHVCCGGTFGTKSKSGKCCQMQPPNGLSNRKSQHVKSKSGKKNGQENHNIKKPLDPLCINFVLGEPAQVNL